MKKLSQFAMMDPAHILDGLFVPRVQKGQALYEVEGEFDGGTIGFRGVQLGAEHQSILLAVAARTAIQKNTNGLLVHGNQGDLMARQSTLDLFPTGEAKGQETSKVNVSAYALLEDAGMGTGGDDYKRLLSLLFDMSTITMYRQRGKKGATSRLLGFKHDGDKISVELNWRMTDAIFGRQNIKVSLHERYGLGSVAKVLHTWLSSHIRPGGRLGKNGGGAFIDTLIPHVWGRRPCTDKVKRNRRQRVREALDEIKGLDGWIVRLEGDKVLVSRPKELPYARKGHQELLPGDIAERMAYDPGDPLNDDPWPSDDPFEG